MKGTTWCASTCLSGLLRARQALCLGRPDSIYQLQVAGQGLQLKLLIVSLFTKMEPMGTFSQTVRLIGL
eukprot:1140344-Pelagomonas_calceolata.AAC.1